MSFSNSPFFQALDSGYEITGSFNGSGERVISYYFGGANELINLGNGFVTSDTVFTSYEEIRIEAALDEYENIINVRFVEVFNASSADLKFYAGETGSSGEIFTSDLSLGFGIPPGFSNSGSIVYNVEGAGWDRNGTAGDQYDYGLEVGGLGYETMVHEIGHGMGLEHPFEGVLFPGLIDANNDQVADNPFTDSGSFDLNQTTYSIMSYTSGWLQHPDGTRIIFADPNGGYDIDLGGMTSSPMAFDVAALQEKYGANTNFNGGNDTYILSGNNSFGTSYRAIWDTAGVDTIRYYGSRDAIINLNDASLNLEANGGGHVSYIDDVLGGFTIANGVQIENATGGSGNDILVGNAYANYLTGGQGNDTLSVGFSSGSGLDVANGGNGNDIYMYYASVAASDFVDAQDGSTADIVYLNDLYIENVEIIVTSTLLYFIHEYEGARHYLRVTGRENFDGYIFEDGVTLDSVDQVSASGGRIDGDSDNNLLSGNVGRDYLYGFAGDDYLTTGKGSGSSFDILNGGFGNDRYVYEKATRGADFVDTADGSTADLIYLKDLNISDVEIIVTSTLLYFIHEYEGARHYLRVTGRENFDGYIFADGSTLDSVDQVSTSGGRIDGDSDNNLLSGNVGRDYLYGFAGDDYLTTGKGSGSSFDILNGGLGNDTLIYEKMSAGADFYDLNDGSTNDRIILKDLTLDGVDVLVVANLVYFIHDYEGARHYLRVTGRENFDVFEFSDGQTLVDFDVNSAAGATLTGDSQNNFLLGVDGANTLIGGAGDDALNGGFSGAGLDTLIGGAGDDSYYYYAANASSDYYDADFSVSQDRVILKDLTLNDADILLVSNYAYFLHDYSGTQHFLRITQQTTMENYIFADGLTLNFLSQSNSGGGAYGGSALNDYIELQANADSISTGDGADVIAVKSLSGHDVVTDFDVSFDKILFDEGLFMDFADVSANAQTVSGDTLITLDANNTLTLDNVAFSSLDADDFFFV